MSIMIRLWEKLGAMSALSPAVGGQGRDDPEQRGEVDGFYF